MSKSLDSALVTSPETKEGVFASSVSRDHCTQMVFHLQGFLDEIVDHLRVRLMLVHIAKCTLAKSLDLVADVLGVDLNTLRGRFERHSYQRLCCCFLETSQLEP
jgi:hypothetical protein